MKKLLFLSIICLPLVSLGQTGTNPDNSRPASPDFLIDGKPVTDPLSSQFTRPSLEQISSLYLNYTFNNQLMLRLPTRSVNRIAATIPGVTSINGGTPSFNGARPEHTAYFIDGIRVAYPGF